MQDLQRRAIAGTIARMMRRCLQAVVLAVPVLLSGCASYGTVVNRPLADVGPLPRYSVVQALHSERSNQVTLVLAFSGGGSRAAALAYGVMQALRDTRVMLDGRPRRLLDEIDAISAVSGGSFTAAYYGLFGDELFSAFEPAFLRSDIGGELVTRLFYPSRWFAEGGRTEMAIDYYDQAVFRGATFNDLLRADGPLIAINATDLGRGVRFSFLQDYFDLLCSDLSSFPVARAVAASSAVPVLFHPVVVENHAGCDAGGLVLQPPPVATGSARLDYVQAGLRSYALKDQRRYIHLIDGGITDNLGLLAIYEMVEVAGGVRPFLDEIGAQVTPRFVVISVDASTTPQYGIEQSNRVPSLEDTINLVTDVQVHRTNATTRQLMQSTMQRWSAELSTGEQAIEPYFIEAGFEAIEDPVRRQYFNQVPTSFTLTDEQVDALVAAGRELLLANPEFRRFLADLQGRPGTLHDRDSGACRTPC